MKLEGNKLDQIRIYISCLNSNNGWRNGERGYEEDSGRLVNMKKTRILCNKYVPHKVKRNMYKTAVRPAMLYGMEKKQKTETEVAEMRMHNCSLGETRIDKTEST